MHNFNVSPAKIAVTALCLTFATCAFTFGALACDATVVRGLVGEPAASLDLERARISAGAASVKTFVRGRAYTMESNSERLSIFVDTKGAVVAVSCG